MSSDTDNNITDFRAKVITTVVIVSITAIILILLASTLSIIPLILVSVLIGILFHSLAKFISEHTPIPKAGAVVVILLVLVAVIAIFFMLVGPIVIRESSQLVDRLPDSIEEIRSQIQQYSWGQTMLDNIGQVPTNIGGTDIFSRLTGVFSNLFGTLTNFVLIFVAGIYMAIDPDLYKDNFARLFPERYRDRTHEILTALYETLQRWIIARALSMLSIGILTFIGLNLIGMPFALTLSVIAGVLAVIPNIGPLISAVPAVLIGFTESPTVAALAVVVYIAVQQIESYLITPSIEQETVSLPPAVVMLSQILFGLLFGWVGLFIAAPVVALSIVLVRMVYIEGFLGDDLEDVEDNEDGDKSDK